MNCKTWKLFFAFVISVFIPSVGWTGEKDFNAFFKPLPETADNPANPINPAKVELGKMLYFDHRLSKSGFISCNSCHNLAAGGADNLPTSIGHKWQIGSRNAPTVYNASINIAQFWGRQGERPGGTGKRSYFEPKRDGGYGRIGIGEDKIHTVLFREIQKGLP